jgi:hypothetical protein
VGAPETVPPTHLDAATAPVNPDGYSVGVDNAVVDNPPGADSDPLVTVNPPAMLAPPATINPFEAVKALPVMVAPEDAVNGVETVRAVPVSATALGFDPNPLRLLIAIRKSPLQMR